MTLDPMRGYTEWKNLFPSAANFEMDTRTPVGATLCLSLIHIYKTLADFAESLRKSLEKFKF